MLNLSIASNRQKRDANGEKITVADWFRITVFGRDAEIIAQYAKKGSALAKDAAVRAYAVLQVTNANNLKNLSAEILALTADCQ